MAFLSSLALALAPSVVNGVSNLIGNSSTNSANARQNELNRQWQSQENELSRQFTREQDQASRYFTAQQNELSRDWQEKMWNLQNQYNTPSAMMQRYKDAGMNPFLSQMAQLGQGAGSAGTPASSATAPMSGSAPMSGAPSSIPMVAPRFDLSLQDMGIASNIANQHANTQQQKWETYQYIREHVGRDAAKRFIDGNPDMFQSSDPDNDPWMKSYKRAEMRENLQNSILEIQDWLLSRYGDQEHQKALQEADARIEDIISKMNDRDANIALMTEQMATEVARQFQLYASGRESNAKALTENQIRKWMINKLVYETGLASFAFQRDKAVFDSEEELRSWLQSDDGKQAVRDLEKNGVLTNPNLVFRYIYQFLDHLPFAAGASVSKKY